MSKRTVATDALETLGTIIDSTQKRDAIHLAVEPVEAGERLVPGEHVYVTNGVAWAAGANDESLGIVDPFLSGTVKKGQRFWFVMNPRTVTSLRHVWAHPAFPDEPVAGRSVTAQTGPSKEESEAWLRKFADTADVPGYEDMMEVVSEDNGYPTFGSSAGGEIPDEFWPHAENVLDRKLRHRPKYFSCSC